MSSSGGDDVGDGCSRRRVGRCPAARSMRHGLAMLEGGHGASRRRHRRQGQDSQRRPEPLRAVGHAAGWFRLGPDHHARRQPRLGCVGHGRRHRPRHRVRHRRRAVPGHHLRLRARADTPSAKTAPPVPCCPLAGNATIKGVVDAVKIYVPTTGGVGGLPGADLGRPAGRRDRQADRQALGHADQPRQRRHRSSGPARATPTASSRSPTFLPAPTR